MGLREELQAGANGRRARPGREPAQGQRLRQRPTSARCVRKGRRGVSEIRLGFLEGAMRGRGLRKNVCDWWVLPWPGSLNGSLGIRPEKSKGEEISPEPPAKMVTAVIPELQQGVASSNGVERLK